MDFVAYKRLEALAQQPEQMEKTVSYVAEHLRLFLKRNERVLICFPSEMNSDLSKILDLAVRKIDAIPLFWGPDYRWKTLLRQAFDSRATAVIGPPLVVLGLSKLAKATGTPLNIRNVILAAYPSLSWMTDGIIKGLDCAAWGFFNPGGGSVVSGFSCVHRKGVHIREDAYEVQIVNSDGKILPEGEPGEVVLRPREDPSAWFYTAERALLDRKVCECGSAAPRLVDFGPGSHVDPTLIELGEKLYAWTSILDCHLHKGESGLEIELVVFPGEKLPKLPVCAKRIIRPWDPERDVPMEFRASWKNEAIYGESH